MRLGYKYSVSTITSEVPPTKFFCYFRKFFILSEHFRKILFIGGNKLFIRDINNLTVVCMYRIFMIQHTLNESGSNRPRCVSPRKF